MFVAGIAAVIFFGIARTWGIASKRASVQTDLQMDGRSALQKILRSIRQEMVGLEAAAYADDDFQEALIILADTNADGNGDSLKGWGIRILDDNDDDTQDRIDTDGDGVAETALWELIQITASSTLLSSSTVWKAEVLCKSLSSPWTTSDESHVYRPFEYSGSDVDLDLGDDGTASTSDNGEDDGLISETELGNFINDNGVIDHAAESAKISTIGLGIRVLKRSAFDEIESIIIYQGTVDPRNWDAYDDAS
jgi:hypothetical protein